MSKTWGLPIPFSITLPQAMLENQDAGSVALVAAMDAILAYLAQDAERVEWCKRIDQCPDGLLDELGYLVVADLKPYDTPRLKRQKITTTVEGHKHRCQWAADAKPKIDAITGFSASIYGSLAEDWPVRVGDGAIEVMNPTWMTRGGDGATYIGIIRTGSGTEIIYAGNIYIDVGTNTLTALQVQQVVDALSFDIAPAYMRLFIGYMAAGVFVTYSGGQIG